MCSINGCIIFKDKKEESVVKTLNEKIINIIKNGDERGKDGFGISSFNKEFESNRIKVTDKCPTDYFKYKEVKGIVESDTKVVINNDRAEPTTEYIKNKRVWDVQPFNYNDIYVVHNGTIANDKELETKYNLKRDTKIDTAIIPSLLDKIWKYGDRFALSEILINKIIGSFALAIYKTGENKLYLATNYKPLFIHYDKNLDTLFFSSLEKYMSSENVTNVFNTDNKIIQVKPYTLLEIDIYSKKILKLSLYDNNENKKRALVIASGGLDSTACISWALKQGYDVELLHYQYNARAGPRELKAIKEISDFYNLPLHIIPTDIFSKTIKHSRLTNPEEGDLVKTNEGEASAELAWEWVPARNLIFMSIAAGFAEANKFDYIILGGNLEESGAYPDNELIFQQKFNEILPYALNLGNHVEVLTPIAHLMKHQIIKLGIDLKTPLNLTWSCYENRETPCQKCGPDYMRRVGFKMNGYIDMQADDKDSKFWEDCKELKWE